MEIICFMAGMLSIMTQQLMPCLVPIVFLLFRPKIKWLFYFLGGGLYVFIYLSIVNDNASILTETGINHAQIRGYVSSIARNNPLFSTFYFDTESINDKKHHLKLLINCYRFCPKINAAEHLLIDAKIKRARNLNNPGSFNYVQSLKAKGIDGIGYLQNKNVKHLPNQKWHYPILRLRNAIHQHINHLPLSQNTKDIVNALTVGIGHDINKISWDMFRHTGTIHLMVISGAHIGFIAGIIFLMIRYLSPFIFIKMPNIPAQFVAAIGSILGAFLYTLIAGSGIPAVRAFIVWCFLMARFLMRCQFSSWQSWRYALCIILIGEPTSILMPGFYLSFLAVAILIMASQIRSKTLLFKIIKVQSLCMLGLLPFTIYWFSYGSVTGVIANLLAVPWVGFVIIPLSFLSLISGSHSFGQFIGWMLNYSVAILMTFLKAIEQLEFINIQFFIYQFQWIILLVIIITIIFYLPFKRFLMLLPIYVLSIVFPKMNSPSLNSLRVNVFDVGQGLAILLRTHSHTLLFDTGAKFLSGADMGQRVILPYLKTQNIHRLDMVVISHPDLDHRGGLHSILETIKVDNLLVNQTNKFKKSINCHQYPAWQWDGIKFSFIPLNHTFSSKNDDSCTLKITAGQNGILLTGDIEKKAEHYFVKKFKKLLHSTVLVVPHHSSKTSSTEAFLKAVNPKLALSSYGFNNRYHFPHPSVVKRYQALKIPVYNTATSGMLELNFSSNGSLDLYAYMIKNV